MLHKKNNSELSYLECLKVISITLIGILVPAIFIGYICSFITNLNFFISSVIGIIIVFVIAFLLGFHEPAYLNKYNGDEYDDDCD